MNLEDYISSGNLELYALDALTPEDKSEAEKVLKQSAEAREELNKIQLALTMYAQAFEKNPHSQLRQSIIDMVSSSSGIKPEAKTIPITKVSGSNVGYKYLLAACLAALLISTFSSYFFYDKWSDAEDRYVSIQNEKNVLAQQYTLTKSDFDKSMNDLLHMRDENMKVYTMSSVDSSKNYLARVYYNTFTKETFVDVNYLPEPPSGKQYQLWALFDGKPVDAGVFDINNTALGLQKVKSVQGVQAFAVTLEPAGGSVSPTLDQMYIISKG